MKPYGILSDTHNHGWNAFSVVDKDGVNSRLTAILDELERAVVALVAAGGDTIYHAGDLFHVRGSVAPSVLNPTREKLRYLCRRYKVRFRVMPGNHDMEMKEASKVGDSVQAVAGKGVEVIDAPKLFDAAVLMVPWIADIEKLKETLLEWRNQNPHMATVDVIIHAPVDGVIKGIPDHGLDPKWLMDLGFNRVFAGHYHNHVDFGNGVYSIGALCHHTWSDVGSKAGFLIVTDTDVQYHASRAPLFVDLEPGMDEVAIRDYVDGNFVRARVDASAGGKSVADLREYLTKLGAKGVSIMSIKAPTNTRASTGTVIKAGSSLEVSVAEYINARKFSDPSRVVRQCQKILSDASVL